MKKIVLGLIILVLSFFIVISCTQEQVQNAEPENTVPENIEQGNTEPGNTEPEANPLFGIWSVQTDVSLPEDWYVES